MTQTIQRPGLRLPHLELGNRSWHSYSDEQTSQTWIVSTISDAPLIVGGIHQNVRRDGEGVTVIPFWRTAGRLMCGTPETHAKQHRCASCGETPDDLYKLASAPDRLVCLACYQRPYLPQLGDVKAIFTSAADLWTALTVTAVGREPVLRDGEYAAAICNRHSLSLISSPTLEVDPVQNFGNQLFERRVWLISDESLPIGTIWFCAAFPQDDDRGAA